MNPGFLSHAFERFRQADSGETQKTTGLGLGLSIVKNLVEMHEDSIQAMSQGIGKGSTFLINLSVTVVHSEHEDVERVHPHSAVASSPSEVRGISLRGVKVLVVDNEADARAMVQRVLAATGADVNTATSAAEAL